MGASSRPAGSPTGTGPPTDGTASTYWAIAASDGAPGDGAPAVAGDANSDRDACRASGSKEHPHRTPTTLAAVDELDADRPRAAGFVSDVGLTLLPSGVVFVLAYSNGSYDTTTWAAAGVLVWWTLGLVLIGVLPGRQPARPTLVTGTLLTLLGAWALVSTQWAADASAAYLQAAEVALYAGAFFLVASTVTRETMPRVLDGIALAIVAIALVALGGRLFPDLATTAAAGRALPAFVERLSWPVGYWNGLAMLVALAPPLVLRHVAGGRSRLASAAAVAAIPPIVADIYLASSRGGAVVGVVAVATFVALCRDRLRVASAAALGVGGGVVAVLALESRPVLVNGPFGSHASSAAGRDVALFIVAIVGATGAAWFAFEPLARKIPTPPRRVAMGVVVAVAVAARRARRSVPPGGANSRLFEPPCRTRRTPLRASTSHQWERQRPLAVLDRCGR